MSENQYLKLPNGLEIELRLRDGLVEGLGAVLANGIPLRSPRRPWWVEIRTPSGERMRDFRLVETTSLDDGGSALTFSCDVENTGMMEWMLHEVRARRNTGDWAQTARPTEAQLRLELRPVERIFDGQRFSGFSYQFFYDSPQFPIYCLLERGTWEPGGHIAGSEFWLRNMTAPPRMKFAGEEFYSTEWHLPGILNPNIFQFFPLQTELQGFTFTAAPQGVLMTWATEVSHVRSLFEKKRETNELEHWHEHCGDLASQFQSAPVEVLWSPGERNETALWNLYDGVREAVWESLHQQANIRREYITTYGLIEEWTPANIPEYAKSALPVLLEGGCETIYLANHFQNNMNTWGVSNFCCNVDWQWSESENVGKENIKAFIKQANAGGAKVEMWGNTALSSLTWILDERSGNSKRIEFLPREGGVMEALDKSDMPFIRNLSGAIEADHYTPIFCALNLRDDVAREYWLNCWKRAHDEVNLEGIFLDSSFNMTSDKFHFEQWAQGAAGGVTADQEHLLGKHRAAEEAPQRVLSQYGAHLELIRQMQKDGFTFCNEDIGVFGVHRHGPGVAERLDNLPMWVECLGSFQIPAIEKVGLDSDEVFFRGLAFRMMWALYWDFETGRPSWTYDGGEEAWKTPQPHQLSFLKAFNRVNEAMQHQRRILEDGHGVLYSAPDGTRVLWAFTDFEMLLKNAANIEDVLSGEQQNAGNLVAQRHRVYRINGEK